MQRRPGGKLHSFGSPSVDQVVNRFLSSGSNHEKSCQRHAVQHLNRQLVELTHLVEAGEARKAELRGRLEAAVRGQVCKWLDDINALGLDELDRLRESLGRHKDRINVRTREILIGANPESVAVNRVGSSSHGGIATVNPFELGRRHPNPSIATIDFSDISGLFEGILRLYVRYIRPLCEEMRRRHALTRVPHEQDKSSTLANPRINQ